MVLSSRSGDVTFLLSKMIHGISEEDDVQGGRYPACNVSSRWASAIHQHHFDSQRRHSGCFTVLPQVSRRPQRQDQDSKGHSWCSQEPPGLYDITEPCCTSDAGATVNHSGRTQPRCCEGGQPFWTHSTALWRGGTLSYGGSSTCKSSLAWSGWSIITWLFLSLLHLLRDCSVVWGS